MQIEKEIEFKTSINNKEYYKLIKKLKLKDKIFKLENFYFETNSKYFRSNKKTLRIRLKDNFYKLTLKSKIKNAFLEKHILLEDQEAHNMIEKGFSLKKYFNLDLNVKPFGKLTTYRVTIPYKDGLLFFDKLIYYNITEYEIEYEANNYLNGLKNFKRFLNENNITYSKTKKKSEKVFSYLEKNI